MTTIEILALIVAVLAIVKILVILVKPKAWLKVVNSVYVQPALTMILCLILSVIVLYWLLAEISIVQIFAVMALIALLAAISFAAYSKDTLAFAVKLMRDHTIVKKAWIAVIIWLILSVWVLIEILA